MSRPVFSFRPNPENPEHRRAWEILQSVPEGQKNLFLVRAILQEDFAGHLEGMVRRAVREELEGVRLEKKSALVEPEVPGVEIPEPEYPRPDVRFSVPDRMRAGKGGGAVLRED